MYIYSKSGVLGGGELENFVRAFPTLPIECSTLIIYRRRLFILTVEDSASDSILIEFLWTVRVCCRGRGRNSIS